MNYKMELEDENKFDFYVGDKVEELRGEGWSDKKIARYLRKKATELHPLRKTKKIIIPKEAVEQFIKKESEKEMESKCDVCGKKGNYPPPL